MKDDFMIKIETWHKPDMGTLENVSKAKQQRLRCPDPKHTTKAPFVGFLFFIMRLCRDDPDDITVTLLMLTEGYRLLKQEKNRRLK